MAASHFLTTATKLQCPHRAAITASTSNTRVKAAQNIVLRSTDGFTVQGCPFTLGTVHHPCVRVRWDVHADHHESHGAPSLTESSLGFCLASDGAMQGNVVIASTQVRGAGS